jgi:hypothetical protein
MARFEPTNDPRKADASPTKAFFVDIVTKDIQLDEAIQDLIDNSVDGAKRLRSGGDFRGLYVHLTVNRTTFEIADNCGGIPLDIARHYAFKFGRAAGFKSTDSSIGQFGIGMKRAIFKIGKGFKVSTTEPGSRYTIEQNIEDWLGDDVSWDFPITSLSEQNFQPEQTGTTLAMPDLADGVGDRFAKDTFQTKLIEDIRARQAEAMDAGLEITLNTVAIIANVWQLKAGEGIAPSFRSFDDPIGSSQLHTRIYAGVAASDRHTAGWYIFCNGRCILEADQDSTTGWSEATEAGVKMPKYHGQFARFRGYAFLDAVDASILPWNTTKTGLDPETAAYRLLKPRLIDAARPVIDFLNALDGETEMDEPDRTLTKAVDRAPAQALSVLPENAAFLYQAPPVRGPTMSRITYKKPKAEMDRLMDVFAVDKPADVGTKSFEFSYGHLVEED